MRRGAGGEDRRAAPAFPLNQGSVGPKGQAGPGGALPPGSDEGSAQARRRARLGELQAHHLGAGHRRAGRGAKAVRAKDPRGAGGHRRRAAGADARALPALPLLLRQPQPPRPPLHRRGREVPRHGGNARRRRAARLRLGAHPLRARDRHQPLRVLVPDHPPGAGLQPAAPRGLGAARQVRPGLAALLGDRRQGRRVGAGGAGQLRGAGARAGAHAGARRPHRRGLPRRAHLRLRGLDRQPTASSTAASAAW